MEKKIITISREFGSGGRTIGHMVAQRLGIPFYDKELVDQIAMESGFAPKFVEENGKQSLAQVFTDVRYPKTNNEFFSKVYYDFIESQGFEWCR